MLNIGIRFVMKPSIYLGCLSIYLLLVLITLADAQINFPEDDGLAPGLKAFPVNSNSGTASASAQTTTSASVTTTTNSLQTFPTALPTPPNIG